MTTTAASERRVRWIAWCVVAIAALLAHRVGWLEPIVVSDDLIFLESSRSAERLGDSWARIHNGHLCPVPRVVTWAIDAVTPSLARIPVTFAIAKFAVLAYATWALASMLVSFGFGWRLRVFAAALFAATGAFHEAVDWYSASFSMLSVAFAMHAVAIAVAAVRDGRMWRVVPMIALVALAALTWGSGVLAGPCVAAAILFAGGSTRARLATAAVALGSSVGVGVWLLVAKQVQATIAMPLALDPIRVLGTVKDAIGNLVAGHNLRLPGAASPVKIGATVAVLGAVALIGALRAATRPVVAVAIVALVGAYAVTTVGRLDFVGWGGILGASRYNPLPQAALALLAVAALRAIAPGRPGPTITVALPLLCALPLVVSHTPPPGHAAFHHDHRRTMRLLRLCDQTFALAARLRIPADALPRLAWLPFERGAINGAYLYTGPAHGAAGVDTATATEFRHAWTELAVAEHVSWLRRAPLRLADRPTATAFDAVASRPGAQLVGTDVSPPITPSAIAVDADGTRRIVLLDADGDVITDLRVDLRPAACGIDLQRMPWPADRAVHRIRIEPPDGVRRIAIAP